MITDIINRLTWLTETIPPLLFAMNDTEFSAKPHPHKWSKKEIIGHLIDSATNNHHRFIRGQFEPVPSIGYNQDKWNAHAHYQGIDKELLIRTWCVYNQFLCRLIPLIPGEKLQLLVNTGGENNYTLEYLVEDYVAHLEHHLKQVVRY